MCLAQGHNTVTPMRLEPEALRSGVKHSTTEPLRSLPLGTRGVVYAGRQMGGWVDRWMVCLFDLILNVPSTIFQLNMGGSLWVEPVLS